MLVTAQSLLITVWLGGWNLAPSRARQTWQSARVAHTLRRLTAVTLIYLGVRTATG